MAYYHRISARAQGKMLAFAKEHFITSEYERILRANRRVANAMYILLAFFLGFMLIPTFLLGKISMPLLILCYTTAYISPILYLVLYFTTFGKEWHQYVKWYKSHPKLGIQNATISDIRGDLHTIKISYDNGYVIHAAGELMPGSIFNLYKSSLTKWQPPHDIEKFRLKDAQKIIQDIENQNAPNKVIIEFSGEFNLYN